MKRDNYCVLVVADDREIQDAIEIYLKNEGLTVFKAKDGIEAIEKLNEHDIHLIILDIMMPRLDGIATTFKIREQKNIPIIILSAKSEDTDKILGLQVGADDYVTKPFNPLELTARVKSQLRRYVSLGTYHGARQVIDLNGLILDQEAKQVTAHGEPVKLTPTEYKILELLMTNAGRVFSINEIYQRVWNEPGYNAENTLAMHICKIRDSQYRFPGTVSIGGGVCLWGRGGGGTAGTANHTNLWTALDCNRHTDFGAYYQKCRPL